MATDKPRFTITLENSLLEQVHEYKRKNNISTQSKAIQRLIEAGISEVIGEISSGSYTTPPKSSFLSGDDTKLLSLYHNLNTEGQEKLLDYADDLVKSEKYIKSDPAAMGKEA